MALAILVASSTKLMNWLTLPGATTWIKKGVTEVWLMKFLMKKSADQVTSLFVKTTISIKKGGA